MDLQLMAHQTTRVWAATTCSSLAESLGALDLPCSPLTFAPIVVTHQFYLLSLCFHSVSSLCKSKAPNLDERFAMELKANL